MVEVRVAQSGVEVVGELYIGSTHVAIQSAINFCIAHGGGKVFVEKGIYTINSALTNCGLYLDSNIELCGEGVGTILKPSFTNSGANSVISIVGTAGAEKENVYIHDLLIGNNISTLIGHIGIYCNYTGKSQTAGLTSGTYSRYDSTTVGVNKNNKIGVKVENCVIQYNNYYGVRTDASANNLFINNLIQSNDAIGVYIYLSSPGATSTEVSGNTLQNNTSYGIYLGSAGINIISENTVQNNGQQGIYLSSNNNSISNNTVQSNNSYGIDLSFSNNNTISGNIVQNNSNFGINMSISNNNTIAGNTVQNNGSYGITVATSSNNNTISDNTAQNNALDGIILSSANNNTVSGNTSTSNNGKGIYISGASYNTVIGNNCPETNASYGIQIASNSNYNVVNGNHYQSCSYEGTGNDITENIQA